MDEPKQYLGQTKNVQVLVRMKYENLEDFSGTLLGTDDAGIMLREGENKYFIPFGAIYCIKYLEAK